MTAAALAPLPAAAPGLVLRERSAPSRPYSLGNPRRKAEGAGRFAEREASSLDTGKELEISSANLKQLLWFPTIAAELKSKETEAHRRLEKYQIHETLKNTYRHLWQAAAAKRAELAELGALGVSEREWWEGYEAERRALDRDECPGYDEWLEAYVHAHGGPGSFLVRDRAPLSYLHTLYLDFWKRRNRPRGINARVLDLEKQYFQLERCQCHYIGYASTCCDSQPFAVPIGCGHRLCPFCASERSHKAQERARAMFDRLEHPQFLTLTIPNVARISKRTVHWLRKRVGELLERYKKLGVIRGGVYAIEATYRRGRKYCWNLHAHAMVDAAAALPSKLWKIEFAGRQVRAFDLIKLAIEYDWTRILVRGRTNRGLNAFEFGGYPRKNSERAKQRERLRFESWVRECDAHKIVERDYRRKINVPLPLSEDERRRRMEWNRRNRRVVDLRAVDDRAAAMREILKYITKSATFADVPEAVEQFHNAVRNARLWQTFGSWYGIKLDVPVYDGEKPEDFRKLRCDCGRNEFARLGTFAEPDVFLDAAGRMRLRRPFDANSRGTVPRPTIRALDARVEPESFEYGCNV